MKRLVVLIAISLFCGITFGQTLLLGRGCGLNSRDMAKVNTTITRMNGLSTSTGVLSIAGAATIGGGATITGSMLLNAATSIPDSYGWQFKSIWTTSADITSGGTYGIYSQTNVAHSVQNVQGIWGRLGFESLAAAEAINSGAGVHASLCLDDTYAVTVTDNISAFTAYVDGTGAVTAANAASTMNGMKMAWNTITNFGIETNGLFIQSIAQSDLDYGVQVESSSAMTAGLYLNNHASNTPSTMTAGVKMKSAASKMTYGIDMSEAGITGAEVLFQNGGTIDNVDSDSLTLTETNISIQGALWVNGGSVSDFAITDYQMPLLDYWTKTQELNRLPAFEGVDRRNMTQYISGVEETAERLLRYIVELEARITEMEKKVKE